MALWCSSSCMCKSQSKGMSLTYIFNSAPPPCSSTSSSLPLLLLLTLSLPYCLCSCGNQTTLGRRGCWSKSMWRPTFGKTATVLAHNKYTALKGGYTVSEECSELHWMAYGGNGRQKHLGNTSQSQCDQNILFCWNYKGNMVYVSIRS